MQGSFPSHTVLQYLHHPPHHGVSCRYRTIHLQIDDTRLVPNKKQTQSEDISELIGPSFPQHNHPSYGAKGPPAHHCICSASARQATGHASSFGVSDSRLDGMIGDS